jgi:hypothetical protein
MDDSAPATRQQTTMMNFYFVRALNRCFNKCNAVAQSDDTVTNCLESCGKNEAIVRLMANDVYQTIRESKANK